MNAALPATFACADPPPGTLVGPRGNTGARLATKRPVPLGIQGIDLHLVQADVLPYLELTPEQNGIELDESFVTFLNLLEIGPRPSFGAPKPRHPAFEFHLLYRLSRGLHF